MGGSPYKIAFRRTTLEETDLHDKAGLSKDQLKASQAYHGNQDGYAEVDVNREGVFLIIHPPKKKGVKVKVDEVLNVLKEQRT